jgi:serine protease Do
MVEDATAVEVVLADNRQFKAKIIGSDPLSDVAVVQIRGGDLPEASLGNSESLPIGSLVIAIGNPFGYESSVTMGVISAKHRQIRAREGVVLQDLLQTDAAINPGNSGGALIDLSGNVVGMPTAIIQYAQGIGFAVSVDVAKLVAERIIATGRMAWPWIGISLRSMNPEEAKRMETPDGKGTLVVEVAPSGPAARAGLRPHDVILKLGETPTPDGNALLSAVRAYKVGDRVALTVWRTGKEVKLTITLGEMPVR